jgi:uracil-DNA glycosylase family 4
MAKVLDKKTSEEIRERLRFYRELGVWDFYRRDVPDSLIARLEAELAEAESTKASAQTEVAPVAATEEIEGEELAKSRKPAVAIPPAAAKKSTQPLAPTSAADRVSALKVIREDLGDCTRCVLHQQGRKQIVFGVGNVRPDIMFVGEAPGADEDEQGEPFVGRAGQLLNNMIQAMGIKREDVYIANVCKCRPPGNRTPEKEESDTCSPFLMRQIAVVRPKVIVALGAIASKAMLGVNDSMANLRGKIYDFTPKVAEGTPEDIGFSTKLVVTYHPAYLLRDPRQKKETWKDLQMVMKYLGMAVPKKAEE